MTPFSSGLRIGLLGGSFDPPHGGHVHISIEALRRFGLDRVVWLISPGNPLKPNPPAPLEHRLKAAQMLCSHPRIMISDIEARLGTRYTADTLRALKARAPQARFTWLMGADNLAQIHRWRDWHSIFCSVPVGILARPGSGLAALHSPAARHYANKRLPERNSRALGSAASPAWCFAHIPLRTDNSSALRSPRSAEFMDKQ